ncbi:alpha/beta hydrolase [Flavobacterium sp. CLA17]|nr:alpha/beta hydrolase [Flavobacterium sp. CLA17]
MFISGAFVSYHYWDEWLIYFESRGYNVVAVPWLHKNDSVGNLRTYDPCNKIGLITLSNLLCYYTEIIEKLQEKPILIGHSYGGLLVQLLVQKNLASAGICISSFPPSGFTTLKFLFYRNLLNFSSSLFSKEATYFLSFRNWQKLLFNTVPLEEQQDNYEKFIIPESQKALRDLLLRNTKVNYKEKHVPLFFIATSEDRFVSPELIYWNFKKYKNFHSITCYKKIENQSHFLILQSQWKEIAKIIADWLEKIH